MFNNEWSGMVNNVFNTQPQAMQTDIQSPIVKQEHIVSEADIFGTNDNARKWSNFTTESEDEPIINLVSRAGNKRRRGKSLSEGDLKPPMPPRQRLRQNVDDYKGVGVTQTYDISRYLPPIVNDTQQLPPSLTPTVMQGMNDINIKPKKRGRGRPKKSVAANKDDVIKQDPKYAGLKKSERERLRRKELKEGYQKLTDRMYFVFV